MEDMRQLEQILESEFNDQYSVTKEIQKEENGNVDYVISSKVNPLKRIFLSYRDNAAMIFDVIKMEHLKRIEFKNEDNEYIVYCGGPSDEINEDVADAAGIRYYKTYPELETNLKSILREKIGSP